MIRQSSLMYPGWRVPCMMAAICLSLAIGANDLVWTGASSDNWRDAGNWVIAGTTTAATYADGDNVRIDDTSSTATIILDAQVTPGNVVFDITRDVTIKQTTDAAGFGSATASIDKYGIGTLTFQSGKAWSKTAGNLNKCDIRIFGGTVVSGYRAVYNTFGDSKEPFWVRIYDGGKLWLRHHCSTGISTDSADSNVTGNMNVHVVTGGVLLAYSDIDSTLNNVGWLLLDGGTLRIGGGAFGGLGPLEVRRGIRFRGAPSYEIGVDTTLPSYNSNYGMLLRPHVDKAAVGDRLIEFDVPDLSGGEGRDVTWAVPLRRQTAYAQTSNVGILKTGAGHLAFATSMSGSSSCMDGDIKVMEGVFELGYAKTFTKQHAHELYIGTNAEVRITAADAISDSGATSHIGESAIRVDHGTLKLLNPTSDPTNAEYAAVNYLGSLIVDHGTVDWSGLVTGMKDHGFMQLGRLLTITNDLPVRWTSDGVPNAGISVRTYYGGFTHETTDTQWILDHYTNKTTNCGTEIRVPNIDGGNGWDFLIDMPIFIMRCRNPGAFIRSGFIKTGDGTLCLNNSSSRFCGDITVREGTLMVSETVADRSGHVGGTWSMLGSLNNDWGLATLLPGKHDPARTICVETNATLWFNGRNAFPQYALFTNRVFNVDVIVKGGTIKLSTGGITPFPNLKMEDGHLEYADGFFPYGIFKVAGTFEIAGSTPLTLPVSGTGQNQMITLNGNPATIFKVNDVTGDPAADLTVDLNLGRPSNGEYANRAFFGTLGFRKTGAGTMRYTAPLAATRGNGLTADHELDGNVSVEEGEFRLDGDLSAASSIAVSSGAYLSGTGRVSNVSIAAGGGLRIVSQQKKKLVVTGNATLSATGTIDIVSDPSSARTPGGWIMEVAGTFTHPSDFSGWTVTVDGVARPDLGIVVDGGRLGVGSVGGLVFHIR